MKLILVMVTSVDGRSTHGAEEGTHNWNSEEDKKHFREVIDDGKLLIMGSTTYEQARSMMVHSEGKLRVVITRDPSKYEKEKIPGKLEFSNENPKSLLERLGSQGFSKGYLLGGAHTNTEFFKQNLISEIWITIEPKILGVGNGLLGEEWMDIDLKLLSADRLNKNGTLLLKFKLLNNFGKTV